MTLINASEAAKQIGRSRFGLYKLVARHGIPHVRIDGVLSFDPADLDRWIALQKTKAHHCSACGQHVRRLRKVS